MSGQPVAAKTDHNLNRAQILRLVKSTLSYDRASATGHSASLPLIVHEPVIDQDVIAPALGPRVQPHHSVDGAIEIRPEGRRYDILAYDRLMNDPR